MGNFDWTTTICLCGFSLLALALMMPVFIFFNKIGKKQTEEVEKYQKSIRDNGGVLAPAVVVGARVLSGGRRKSGPPSFIVRFEVEVTPNDGPSFRTKFRHYISPNGYKIENYEMVSEYGMKLWVMYNPKNTSQVYLDHYDEDHAAALAQKDWEQRRNRFVDGETEATRVREVGEEVIATILEVDDLMVATTEEQREGRTMRIKFRASPTDGFPFETETYAMIANELLPKAVVGSQVYIKYDPQKTEISAWIRSANS